jgi:hypothetical protein
VVHGIVELGIKRSVWEVSNFFSRIAYRVGGMDFSPDDIEHGILRANTRPPYRLLPVFKWGDARRDLSLEEIDPRIHFALVCGSRSCAPIHFYEADSIDRQLDKAAHNFINSSEVIITPEENKIFLSQIFNWYEKDFGGRDGVIQYLLQYLEEEEKARFLEKNANTVQREYLFYDWNLNH